MFLLSKFLISLIYLSLLAYISTPRKALMLTRSSIYQGIGCNQLDQLFFFCLLVSKNTYFIAHLFIWVCLYVSYIILPSYLNKNIISAKCISIRSVQGCEKHLLLRDSCGPVLQAVFYEIDFLMPKIEPGATVR